MKVLHITTNYPTPEYPVFGIFVKEQVESLKSLGLDCEVLYCDRKGRGKWMYITYIPRIWWRILTGHYDVIHCHHALTAMLLMCTLWPLFKKCVVSFQNDPTTEWAVNVFGFIHPFFDAIILKNKSPYLERSKTVYLPNGCNQDFFRPLDREECIARLGLDPKKRYIVYMDSNKWGRKQKRQDRFDAAIEILRTQYGHTDVEALKLFNTPRELIPYYFNACALHMLSSDFEGSPNSVKECICCNTPVVSTDVGNVKDMIGDIPGCHVVNQFTAEALASAVDEVLRTETVFDGRALFLAKGYSMEAVARRLSELYKRVCI